MDNKIFKKVEVYKELHQQIGMVCWKNDIQIRVLTSKMLETMLTKHKEEVEQIIKEIKIKRGN